MDDAIGVIIEPSSFDMLIAWLLFDSKVKGADEPRILGSHTDIAMTRGDVPSDLILRRVAHRPLGTIPLTDHVGASSIK